MFLNKEYRYKKSNDSKERADESVNAISFFFCHLSLRYQLNKKLSILSHFFLLVFIVICPVKTAFANLESEKESGGEQSHHSLTIDDDHSTENTNKPLSAKELRKRTHELANRACFNRHDMEGGRKKRRKTDPEVSPELDYELNNLGDETDTEGFTLKTPLKNVPLIDDNYETQKTNDELFITLNSAKLSNTQVAVICVTVPFAMALSTANTLAFTIKPGLTVEERYTAIAKLVGIEASIGVMFCSSYVDFMKDRFTGYNARKKQNNSGCCPYECSLKGDKCTFKKSYIIVPISLLTAFTDGLNTQLGVWNLLNDVKAASWVKYFLSYFMMGGNIFIESLLYAAGARELYKDYKTMFQSMWENQSLPDKESLQRLFAHLNQAQQGDKENNEPNDISPFTAQYLKEVLASPEMYRQFIRFNRGYAQNNLDSIYESELKWDRKKAGGLMATKFVLILGITMYLSAAMAAPVVQTAIGAGLSAAYIGSLTWPQAVAAFNYSWQGTQCALAIVSYFVQSWVLAPMIQSTVSKFVLPVIMIPLLFFTDRDMFWHYWEAVKDSLPPNAGSVVSAVLAAAGTACYISAFGGVASSLDFIRNFASTHSPLPHIIHFYNWLPLKEHITTFGQLAIAGILLRPSYDVWRRIVKWRPQWYRSRCTAKKKKRFNTRTDFDSTAPAMP